MAPHDGGARRILQAMECAVRYPLKVIRWFVHEKAPRVLYLCAAGFMLSLASVWLPIDDGELKVRIAAFLLQGGGILTVALDIMNTRKLFNRPGLLTELRQWIARFPRWGAVVGAGGVSAGAATMAGLGSASFSASGTLNESEMDILRRETERIGRELRELRTRLDLQESKHAQDIQDEKQQRERRDAEIEGRLEDLATGGLHLSFVGVVWLLTGVFLGSVPDFVANIFIAQ